MHRADTEVYRGMVILRTVTAPDGKRGRKGRGGGGEHGVGGYPTLKQ